MMVCEKTKDLDLGRPKLLHTTCLNLRRNHPQQPSLQTRMEDGIAALIDHRFIIIIVILLIIIVYHEARRHE